MSESCDCILPLSLFFGCASYKIFTVTACTILPGCVEQYPSAFAQVRHYCPHDSFSFLFHRPRNVEPVCSNLQSQILNCYRENREQTLQCSDLAKEYMQCINAAKKVRNPKDLAGLDGKVFV